LTRDRHHRSAAVSRVLSPVDEPVLRTGREQDVIVVREATPMPTGDVAVVGPLRIGLPSELQAAAIVQRSATLLANMWVATST
jgi:hypothetical protein